MCLIRKKGTLCSWTEATNEKHIGGGQQRYTKDNKEKSKNQREVVLRYWEEGNFGYRIKFLFRIENEYNQESHTHGPKPIS